MKTSAFALLVATVLMMPAGLRACDCGCDDPPKVIHFTDGIPSNGPVTGDPGAADPAHYRCSLFGFQDYGPAHAAPPAPVSEPKDMKRPSS